MAAKIREATQDDLPGLAALFGHRDGLGGPHPGTRRALLNLDPARIRVWIAVDPQHDDRVVAMTCAELRKLRVGGAEAIDAGYWTNLFIHEDYRDQLLYPRLPQTMLRALTRAGVSRVYLAIRRLDVAEAHLRIGYREITRWVVRLKPLRPLSLATKHLRWPAIAQRVAEPVDRLAQLPLRVPGWRPRRLPRGHSLVHLSLPEDAEGIAALLARVRAGHVAREWNADTITARYEPAADGAPYRVLGLCRTGDIIGVVAVRVATRETGVRVGVIMELATRDDDELLALLLRGAERSLRAEGVDGVLLLDSLGPAVSAVARRAGYLDSRERYVLIAAPKKTITDDDAMLDADAWRFPFADHDAF